MVKDIQISTRYRFSFVVGAFLPALVNLGLFSTVFFGFFKSGAAATAGVSGNNFVVFTVLGAMLATLFSNSFSAYQNRFQYEKYWQTAYAILASPLSPWAVLLGVGFTQAVQFLIIAIPFVIVAYILSPVGPGALLFTALYLVLLYLMVSGLSLVRGAIFLVNENLDPVFTYFVVGTGYLSCFYYPASFIPSFFQPLASINPVYFVVNLVRALWLNLPAAPGYVEVAIAVAVLSPAIGTYFYQKVWRNLDITGY